MPDVTKLKARESAAWQRCLFPLPWDIGRLNIMFEGGIRFFEDAEFVRVIEASDTKVIPLLARAVEVLDRALAQIRPSPAVLEDQRDRYRGLLLCVKSDRNLFEAQLAINAWLLGSADRSHDRERIRAATLAEIENTREWIRVLSTCRTHFFRVAETEETPFVYRSPIEDFQVKLEAMRAHLDGEPGPFLPELREPKRKKLAFGAVA